MPRYGSYVAPTRTMGIRAAVDAPRPSAADARRVNRLIMRGEPVEGTDRPVANAVLARYDGYRGKLWIGVLCVVLGAGNAVAHIVTHSAGWLNLTVGALLTVAGTWWIYTVRRVRAFRRQAR